MGGWMVGLMDGCDVDGWVDRWMDRMRYLLLAEVMN